MSGLLMKRTLLGGVALVAMFGFAACSDDDGGEETPTAGTGGKGSGGSAGSAHAGDGGAPEAAGSSNGGKAGNVSTAGTGGTPAGGGTGGSAVGGSDMGPGGEGGVGGLGGGAGEGGEGGKPMRTLRDDFAGMSPLPAVPADPTNSYADNAAAAALGQKFFFDEKLSGVMAITNDLGTKDVDAQKVSCHSCHSGSALDDERSSPDNISQGTGLHSRNAPGMVNSSFYTWTNWGGRFAAQWELPPAVLESKVIMNGNRLALAHRVYDVYKADYEPIFGNLDAGLATVGARFPAAGKPKAAVGDVDGVWEGLAADDKVIVNRILANFGKALAAYTRKLVSREAKFDAWMAGDDSAFSASQLNGAKLFRDKGCLNCHNGATFSDQGFHDLGVPQTGPGVLATDDGRAKDLPLLLGSGMNVNSIYSDKQDTGKLDGLVAANFTGKFRTPSLRGVTQSAPYMHSGQFATLEAVIDFYAVGGNLDTGVNELVPFAITPQEKADLIAFLGTLSGKAVPDALLVDNAPN